MKKQSVNFQKNKEKHFVVPEVKIERKIKLTWERCLTASLLFKTNIMKIENIRIKILKDTPFNLAGEVLKLADFRQIYNYICTNSTSNEELVKYIKDWKSYPALKQTTKYCINEWFEVIELEELPLEFIHEGIYYTKDMDGEVLIIFV